MKKRFEKVYVEITNICNLDCSFCPGHIRKAKSLTSKEFDIILDKITPYTNSVFFHLMGEPTCHKNIADFIKKVNSRSLKSILTTNGTLLHTKKDILLDAKPYRVNISLHSFEANKRSEYEIYLNDCFDFAKSAAEKGIYAVLRLWNNGGQSELNDDILTRAENFFGKEKTETLRGFRISNRVFVEFGDKFEWQLPQGGDSHGFCLGLRDQIGILSNGNVVPCCLDNNSDITLGNIFESDLESIVNSERAIAMLDGFSKRTAVEERCIKCGYRRKFS